MSRTNANSKIQCLLNPFKSTLCIGPLVRALPLALLVCWTVFFVNTSPAAAQEQVLSLRNGQVQMSLTDADLMALPQQSFQTTTPWNAGRNSYAGPSLKNVLALLGPVSELREIKLIAANDYIVDLPLDMLEETYPIVTTRLNDAPFSLRDKGPLWVMFPFDSEAQLQTGLYHSRAVWQLTAIETRN